MSKTIISGYPPIAGSGNRSVPMPSGSGSLAWYQFSCRQYSVALRHYNKVCDPDEQIQFREHRRLLVGAKGRNSCANAPFKKHYSHESGSKDNPLFFVTA